MNPPAMTSWLLWWVLTTGARGIIYCCLSACEKCSSFALWINLWSGNRCQKCGQWFTNGQLPKSATVALKDNKNSLADRAALQIPRGLITYEDSFTQPSDFIVICLMPDPEVTDNLNGAPLPICWAPRCEGSPESPVINTYPSSASREGKGICGDTSRSPPLSRTFAKTVACNREGLLIGRSLGHCPVPEGVQTNLHPSFSS